MPQILTYEDFKEFEARILKEIEEIKKALPSISPKKWLRSSDIKELLGISHGKLQTMRNNREIPFTVIGGTIFYSLEDVNKMLDAKKQRKF
ncbi:helix-turn-helix domain-containing protein [Dysgonomonas sp. Marseille-P4677]|uniref:helix-turn-helix domain-containing protein n=1 Tax=Dysgonomonas sp. Marseille-P4677 TaxID=2364790 RepID=UPI0019114207|nr:helix-turn-helix domain-containing protein [Dysgonomonas sp. Marseille-P4677]MBK5722687.1 helix-turn-helix domain-containing protein [Dysgonomonas sp. Marseille-P4677]